MKKRRIGGYRKYANPWYFYCWACNKKSYGFHGEKYCSETCRLKYETKSAYPGLCSGTVGAIQELYVSIDLMAKGFEVFRALSPASSCDLIALKNNSILRIEVKTGQRNKRTQKIYCSKSNLKADYLAIVLPYEIIYEQNGKKLEVEVAPPTP